jgi:predicted ATPase
MTRHRKAELLQVCPKLKLLVTSRAAPRLSGDWGYQLEPLPEERRCKSTPSRELAYAVALGAARSSPIRSS